MKTIAKTLAGLAIVILAPAAMADIIGSREHAHTTEHGHGTRSTISTPLAPVLGRALVAARIPEAAALQSCAAGWPVNPIFARAQAQAWAARQAQAACVVNAAETALANSLTRRTWPSADALQQAADAAAKRLDLTRIRRACPLPAEVVPVSGDEVTAQIDNSVALVCGPDGVTINLSGARIFGGGVIDGREYSIAIDQSASGSTSDKSSVGGAFLSP